MTLDIQVRQIQIIVDGANIPHELMNELVETEVDTSLSLPSMFTLRFLDNEMTWLDNSTFDLGKAVEVRSTVDDDTFSTLIKGEITAIEPSFGENNVAMLVVRGYDKRHRMLRGAKSQVFVNVSDSDIVKKICGEYGLSPQADATKDVREHVFQDSQTDLEFLYMLAARNGFEIKVNDTKLYFRKPQGDSEVSVEWGKDLMSFHPRLTTSGQVDKVTVKGWDSKKKEEIIGEATSSRTNPAINVGGSGGAVAKKSFSAAEEIQVRQPVSTQKEAETRAQAILDEINAQFVEAEGVADGNPQLIAGNKIKVTNVGNKFSGSYIITSATHVYNQDGSRVYFTIEGAHRRMVSDLLRANVDTDKDDDRWGGVVTAIVTNIKDEEDLGRVKVKFPWIDDKLEGTWARVAAPGAGKERGVMFMPEVNDEVLVAFEHSDFNHPYIIGGLWNSKDKLPETYEKNGEIAVRTIKSRSGHIIRMTDEAGKEKIEIIDGKNGTSVILNATDNSLTVNSKGNVEITSKGNLTLKATGNIVLEATGQLNAKGQMSTLEATGIMNVKGSMVNIN